MAQEHHFIYGIWNRTAILYAVGIIGSRRTRGVLQGQTAGSGYFFGGFHKVGFDVDHAHADFLPGTKVSQ